MVDQPANIQSVQARLEHVISEHFDTGDEQDQVGPEGEAIILRMAYLDGPAMFGMAPINKDAKRLQDLTKALKIINDTIPALSPDPHQHLQKSSKKHETDSIFEVTQPVRHNPVYSLMRSASVVALAVPDVAKRLQSLADAGKPDWAAAALVASCRDIWKRRKKEDAPRDVSRDSDLPSRGPFEAFAKAVFNIFEVSISVKTALKNLNEHRDDLGKRRR